MSGEVPVYKDHSKPVAERVSDLVSRMTVEEKVSQMHWKAKAVPRLGIPEYNWWNEALHGVARAGRATVFPQAIGIAAAFDTELAQRIASAVSDEARAKHHEFIRRGDRGHYKGLTFWTPNINIFRDPRWGRGQETYGEDPFLTAEIGKAFVKGLQGNDPKYLKVAACAKHYAVHSGPEKLRHVFNAQVGRKDLFETYLPAFKALVEAGVEAVMGAYNQVNGEPCCGSRMLLIDILRGKWGFKGHVVSDCWAIRDFHTGHKITSTAVQSAALAANNGCDLNCGCTFDGYLLCAVKEGLVSEDTLNRAVSNLLATRFKLGMFDPDEAVPYSSIPMSVVNCRKHRLLAREAAAKSVVLLKNKNNLLPLRKDAGSIFVTGPCAANVDALTGNYYGLSGRFATILEGIVEKAGDLSVVDYRKGCLVDRRNPNPVEWFLGDAQKADVIVAVLGLDSSIEGEEGDAVASEELGDRREITLPGGQADFLKKLIDTGKPLVLVVCAGCPVIIPHDLADAILYVWYPGEEGGNAVADVIFGGAIPAGRLPFTIPKSLDQIPPYEDYSMENRTYRYMKDEPLYPFGFGLSYSSFKYERIRLSKRSVHAGETIEASVRISNTGAFAAEEVVQLYLSDSQASVRVPRFALKGFTRVSIRAGKSKTAKFAITPEMMCITDDNGKGRLEPGTFRVTAGGACPSPRSAELGAAQPVTAEFILT